MGECLASCYSALKLPWKTTTSPQPSFRITRSLCSKGVSGLLCAYREFLEVILSKALIPIMTLLEVLLLHLAHTHYVQWVTVERTSPSL